MTILECVQVRLEQFTGKDGILINRMRRECVEHLKCPSSAENADNPKWRIAILPERAKRMIVKLLEVSPPKSGFIFEYNGKPMTRTLLNDRLICSDVLTQNMAGSQNFLINNCNSLIDALVTPEFNFNSQTVKDDKMNRHCRIDENSKKLTDEFGKGLLYNRATMIFLVGDCKTCL